MHTPPRHKEAIPNQTFTNLESPKTPVHVSYLHKIRQSKFLGLRDRQSFGRVQQRERDEKRKRGNPLSLCRDFFFVRGKARDPATVPAIATNIPDQTFFIILEKKVNGNLFFFVVKKDSLDVGATLAILCT